MILATVAAKGRALGFSVNAFQELELSLALFEKIKGNPVINHALVSLPLIYVFVRLHNPTTALSLKIARLRTRQPY